MFNPPICRIELRIEDGSPLLMKFNMNGRTHTLSSLQGHSLAAKLYSLLVL